MTNHKTIEDAVYSTVHHNNRTVEDISAQTGTGKNHLYRMANPHDECNLPVRLLVPLMNVTEDFCILDFLARKTGHICIKQPRGIRKGTDPRMDISTYSKEFNEMLNVIYDFINNPTDAKRDIVDNMLRKHIGDSENIRRRAKDHKLHQRELNL